MRDYASSWSAHPQALQDLQPRGRLANQLPFTHPPPPSPSSPTTNAQHATREIMQAAGLPTPKHYKISSPEDVAAAAAHVGFPSVIKPISGAASIGVIRVNDEEHLRTAYERVVGAGWGGPGEG